MQSYALNGFLSRCKDGTLIRSTGQPIGHSIINLSMLEQSEILLDQSFRKHNIFEERFKDIARVVKISFCRSKSENQSGHYILKSLAESNSIVSLLHERFIESVNSIIKIIWVENHATLVEFVQNSYIKTVVGVNTEKMPTFIVDITLFIQNDFFIKTLSQEDFLISLLYRLGYVRGISKFLNFSDNESYHIALSLLDCEEEKIICSSRVLCKPNENLSLKFSLRNLIIKFLESYGAHLNLDHDQSLSYCLKETEESSKSLPDHLYYKNVFELEKLTFIEKEKDFQNSIKNCLSKRDKLIILLIKQMDISLPYPRQEFQKSYKHPDIKIRRELCFHLIKNFDRLTETLNITSLVSRLKSKAKYSIIQPKLVVGRESRAFSNQAYLFANSKLIEIDTETLKKANELNVLCTTESLKKIIEEQFDLNLYSELRETLSHFMVKFDDFMHELVPSLGRLISLIFNRKKASSFTQYNGVFQNLREALEIFLRKSTGEVEKQRKKFIEDFYQSSTRSNGIAKELKQLNGLDHVSKGSLFFAKILSALSCYSGKSGQIELIIQNIEEKIFSLYSSSTGSSRGAYSVLLQRPSFAGSERFKLNELETKAEQEEALQKLVLFGGDHLYMSPSYEWISQATDLIEAVPLFIYERTVILNEKPITLFEVDQEGLGIKIDFKPIYTYKLKLNLRSLF